MGSQGVVLVGFASLLLMDRNRIDAASGGVLVDKTPAVARALIANIAANSQQFGNGSEVPPMKVNEVGDAPSGYLL